MQQAYAQVLGSLFEGLGLVAVESSVFGVPTVGTQIGGLDEVVLDGITGLLVPRASSSALADATLRLLNDPELRNRLGEAARARAHEVFDSERLIDELLDMYESDLN
jgi:glycosyltransferase involved in cell wall biosynthesis